jgi:hypothetical protein
MTLFVLGMGSLLLPQARADIALEDFAININGTSYDYNNSSQTDPTTLSGMNASGFSTFTSGDGKGTGLGKIIYTFDPGAPGSYFVNLYFDIEAATPFFNEHGIENGAAPAGTSWEIARVNPSVGGIQFWDGTSQVFPNALDNTNHLPLGNTNYLNNCTVTPCNGDVATALGFAFSLTAGERAIIEVDSSTTNPGGFYLQQVHPIDPSNPAETGVFFSESLNFQVSGVPEPGFLPVLGVALAAMAGYGMRRRFAKSKADQVHSA